MRVTPGPVPRDDSKGESRNRDRSSDRTWSFSSISTPRPGFSTSILHQDLVDGRISRSLPTGMAVSKRSFFGLIVMALALWPLLPAPPMHKRPQNYVIQII